jgi:hypothetical protein
MDRFVAEANIKHFKRRLAEEADLTKREVIQNLLEVEENILAKLERGGKQKDSG